MKFTSLVFYLVSFFIHAALSDEVKILKTHPSDPTSISYNVSDCVVHAELYRFNKITGARKDECSSKSWNASSSEVFRIELWKEDKNNECHVGLDLYSNPKLFFTNATLNISDNERNENETCIKVHLEQNCSLIEGKDSWMKIIRLAPLLTFQRLKLTAFVQSRDKVLRQTFILQNPRFYKSSERPCELERLVYNDLTRFPGKDTLHIGLSNLPQNYHIFNLQVDDEGKWRNVKNFTATAEFTEVLDRMTASQTYRIVTFPNEDKTAVISLAVVLSLLLVSAILVFLWYKSIPRKKTAVVIFCQCQEHEPLSKAVRQLLTFLQKNCFLSVIEGNPSTTPEEEAMISHTRLQPNFVIFVPFPATPDHDRPSEAEVHEKCGEYKTFRNKIELLLPFENEMNLWKPSNDWPRNTFINFKLFEEFAQFVRYLHPFYYPTFMESIVRPQLCASNLESLLRNNAFTNDYMREIPFRICKNEPVDVQAYNVSDVFPSIDEL